MEYSFDGRGNTCLQGGYSLEEMVKMSPGVTGTKGTYVECYMKCSEGGSELVAGRWGVGWWGTV